MQSITMLLTNRKIALGLLALVVFGVLFPLIGQTPLLGPWEPHYGQVARESLQSGNWFDLHYRQEVFWSKPILAPLLATFSYWLFGVNEFATRLPGVLFGAWAILTVFSVVSRRVSLSAGFAVSLALLLTPNFALMSRRFLTDIFFMAPLLVALLYFFEALHFDARKKAKLAWGLIGLAVLAKGLLPLFTAIGVLAAYLVATGQWRNWRQLALGQGIVIFLIVAAPWHLYMAMLYGVTYLKEWFIDHHFGRAAGSLHKPQATFEFLLFYLGIGGFPVVPLLPLGFLAFFKPQRKEAASISAQSGLAYLFAIWFLTSFFIVGFSEAKFPHYAFAMLPPAALFAGLGVARILGNERIEHTPLSLALLASGILLFVIGKDLSSGNRWFELLSLTSDHKIRTWFGAFTDPTGWIRFALIGVLFGLALFLWRKRIVTLVAAGVTGVVAFIYLVYFLFVFDPALLEVFTPKHLINTYLEERAEGERLILYHCWKERSDTWYADVGQKRYIVTKSKAQLARTARALRGKRFFVQMSKRKLKEAREVVESAAGQRLEVIKSDKYKTYEDIILTVSRP